MKEQDYIYSPERKARTHGVVVLIVKYVDGGVQVLYGSQLFNNRRGESGEGSLVGEAREGRETKKQTLERGLREELGLENLGKVVIPVNLRDAWVGSTRFLPGVNAQVFCLQWRGQSGEVPVREVPNGEQTANDFIAGGWQSLKELPELAGLRQGMKNVAESILANPGVIKRIERIAKG